MRESSDDSEGSLGSVSEDGRRCTVSTPRPERCALESRQASGDSGMPTLLKNSETALNELA